MKKLLTVLAAILLVAGLCGCSGGNKKEDEKTPEPETTVKGTVVDFGRVSALVPEGWNRAEIGMYQSEFNGLIVKGAPDAFLEAQSVTIQYSTPVEPVMSSRAMYENTHVLGQYDLGDFHWEVWTGTYDGLTTTAAESYSDKGTLMVFLSQPNKETEPLSFDDPEVQAIIKSIKVVPMAEADWIEIKDGIATVTLPEAEGYEWGDSGTMYTGELDIMEEFDGNTLVITPSSGTGGYSISLSLLNEDFTLKMGRGEVALRVTDGKIDGIYLAKVKIFDEPEVQEEYNYEPEPLDYEMLDQVYSGTWEDTNNDLTMFIQKSEEAEHAYVVSIQSSGRQISTVAVLDEYGVLAYDTLSINGVSVESWGWFNPDGALLIWGRDEAAGEYDNATLFTRVE
ncbi:MAG: hypothetical protein II186_05750 [Erysipelotrichales bacterium]|nr:hypothetical protein [Erysipelotrichales bacterium]MBQ2310133.1 hypothetical protein [Erysipelotrichales bacterium]